MQIEWDGNRVWSWRIVGVRGEQEATNFKSLFTTKFRLLVRQICCHRFSFEADSRWLTFRFGDGEYVPAESVGFTIPVSLELLESMIVECGKAKEELIGTVMDMSCRRLSANCAPMNKKMLVKELVSEISAEKGHHADAVSVSGAISRLIERGHLYASLPGGLGRAIYLVDTKPISEDTTFVLASCNPGSVARMVSLTRDAEELAGRFKAKEIDREADQMRLSTFGFAWILNPSDSDAFKLALERAGFDDVCVR